MSDPLLLLENIHAFHGDAPALRGISMRVNEGEIVSVIGSNGAGKSTLQQSIVGLAAVRSGTITFDGAPLVGRSVEDMASLGIAFVPEGAPVFADMSVLDNLKMGAYVQPARSRRNESLGWVYDLFPILAERQGQKAGSLSGGERRMLAIGRALMSMPRLLLLDEPSVGLAPLLVERLFTNIAEISAVGVTILLVEQNVYLSLQTAHRAYVLENGEITLTGAGCELMNDDRIKRAYLAV